MKYRLSEAITKIKSLLDDQGKTVDVPESSSFDYKVSDFLMQSKAQLDTNIEDLDTQTYAIYLGDGRVNLSPIIL